MMTVTLLTFFAGDECTKIFYNFSILDKTLSAILYPDEDGKQFTFMSLLFDMCTLVDLTINSKSHCRNSYLVFIEARRLQFWPLQLESPLH